MLSNFVISRSQWDDAEVIDVDVVPEILSETSSASTASVLSTISVVTHPGTTEPSLETSTPVDITLEPHSDLRSETFLERYIKLYLFVIKESFYLCPLRYYFLYFSLRTCYYDLYCMRDCLMIGLGIAFVILFVLILTLAGK